MSDSWEKPDLAFLDNPLPEAEALALDSTLARNRLGWNPVWDTERVVRETAAWYRQYYKDPKSVSELTLQQINAWRKEIL
jgi:CDP-glucose 4,6-dehydratase